MARDQAWAEFVATTLADGIGELEELIGADWPAGERLAVVESASPYLYSVMSPPDKREQWSASPRHRP